ncbi:unnamed protein product [Closterium sp. Yama58-4]|nr:unnamed protein product [Closterium sp. Yama58-4]
MAFLRGIGNALRRSVTQGSGSANDALAAFHAPQPHLSLLPAAMSQAVRFMSGNKLFIGGLAWEADEKVLEDAFSPFGTVEEAKVIRDRFTGRSRGFGFVSFANDEEAASALEGVNGKELSGRTVRVDYASNRTEGGAMRVVLVSPPILPPPYRCAHPIHRPLSSSSPFHCPAPPPFVVVGYPPSFPSVLLPFPAASSPSLRRRTRRTRRMGCDDSRRSQESPDVAAAARGEGAAKQGGEQRRQKLWEMYDRMRDKLFTDVPEMSVTDLHQLLLAQQAAGGGEGLGTSGESDKGGTGGKVGRGEVGGEGVSGEGGGEVVGGGGIGRGGRRVVVVDTRTDEETAVSMIPGGTLKQSDFERQVGRFNDHHVVCYW